MKPIEERSGEFVIARGDRAADLEVADHALDAVALAIDALVPTDNGLARGFWCYDVTDAIGLELCADVVGIISLVREEIGGLHLGEREDVLERAVGCFSGGVVEGEGRASGITEAVNFTGEPAPATGQEPVPESPGGRDMMWNPPCGGHYRPSGVSVKATTSQIPASLQRLKCDRMVIHLPYFSGTSRMGRRFGCAKCH